jgi:hypothetical protein
MAAMTESAAPDAVSYAASDAGSAGNADFGGVH